MDMEDILQNKEAEIKELLDNILNVVRIKLEKERAISSKNKQNLVEFKEELKETLKDFDKVMEKLAE